MKYGVKETPGTEFRSLIIFPFPPGKQHSRQYPNLRDVRGQIHASPLQHLGPMSATPTVPDRLMFSHLRTALSPKHGQRNDLTLNSFWNRFNPPRASKSPRSCFCLTPAPEWRTVLSIAHGTFENRSCKLGRLNCSLRNHHLLSFSLIRKLRRQAAYKTMWKMLMSVLGWNGWNSAKCSSPRGLYNAQVQFGLKSPCLWLIVSCNEGKRDY